MLPRTLAAPDLRPTRRGLLLGAAAAGAGLAVGVPAVGPRPAAAASGAPYEGYVHIAPDGTVTVRSAHMDMGQGIYTGLATLVAEELDADWSKVTAVGAAGNPALYGNLVWGGAVQGTGGSTGMASSWERYRRAGATARAMLVAAAAARWGVPADVIEVRDGVVRHPASGRSAGFGELADEAARQAPPAEVRLKDRSEWRLIGAEGLRRYDGRAKATGTETFTIDVRLPGMLTAVVAHPPRFGATAASVDDAAARAVPGVVDVVRISRGVAVVARDTWSAMRGRDALSVTWDESGAETRGSDEILAEYRRLAEGPGELTAVDRGDAAGGIARAARVIDAVFEFPYLAHAALEPLNAVARMQDGRLEVWAGHQIPDVYAMIAAGIAGIPPERAVMHVMKTGGGFGRRAVPDGDVVAEAVEVAKAIGWRAPVKVQWTREDDMRGGRYRPLTLHRVRVGLDDRGRILGWHHRIVGQPILLGTPFEAFVPPSGIDPTVVEGVADTPYALPDFRLEVTQTRVGVPTLWWRSVGHTHTAYVMECMVDEIAAAAGRDPVELRRELLAGHPRHLRVLETAAEAAGWGSPTPAGVHRGVAVHESFASVVAHVVEVSGEPGSARVHRIVSAIDCGTAVNPDTIRAQVEGGAGFGLGAALHEELTLTAGAVDQGNYDDYRPLRMEEMPRVEVRIVPSDAPPTGVGEPGVPPVAPAVANALAAGTGRRIRRLPFDRAGEA